MPNEIRRTENEFILQSMNDTVAEKVKAIAPGDSGASMTLQFRCECSVLNCNEYITLQIDEYQSITRKVGQFLVFPTHEQLDIETVIVRNSEYVIVEKRIDLLKEAA